MSSVKAGTENSEARPSSGGGGTGLACARAGAGGGPLRAAKTHRLVSGHRIKPREPAGPPVEFIYTPVNAKFSCKFKGLWYICPPQRAAVAPRMRRVF